MPAKSQKLACLQKINIVLKDRKTDPWVIACTSGWFSTAKTTILYASSYNIINAVGTAVICGNEFINDRNGNSVWQRRLKAAGWGQQAGTGSSDPAQCKGIPVPWQGTAGRGQEKVWANSKTRGQIALPELWPRVKSVSAALSWTFLIFTAKPLIPHLERHGTANNVFKSQDVNAGWFFCQPE